MDYVPLKNYNAPAQKRSKKICWWTVSYAVFGVIMTTAFVIGFCWRMQQ